MTWVNHKSTTFFLGFLLGFPLWGTAVATVCSVLPDAVEFALRLRHRGSLHNPITYCFVLPLLLVLSPSGLAFWTAIFVLFGIGLHLLEDWASVAGIPVGRGRAALGLYRVGSPAEYLPTALLVAIVLVQRERFVQWLSSGTREAIWLVLHTIR